MQMGQGFAASPIVLQERCTSAIFPQLPRCDNSSKSNGLITRAGSTPARRQHPKVPKAPNPGLPGLSRSIGNIPDSRGKQSGFLPADLIPRRQPGIRRLPFEALPGKTGENGSNLAADLRNNRKTRALEDCGRTNRDLPCGAACGIVAASGRGPPRSFTRALSPSARRAQRPSSVLPGTPCRGAPAWPPDRTSSS